MIKLRNILLEENSSYDRVKEAWKRAYKKVPIRSVGGHLYPDKIYNALKNELRDEFKKEFPNGVFTDKQIYSSLFSDRMKTAMDSWDYLSDIIDKKLKK